MESANFSEQNYDDIRENNAFERVLEANLHSSQDTVRPFVGRCESQNEGWELTPNYAQITGGYEQDEYESDDDWDGDDNTMQRINALFSARSKSTESEGSGGLNIGELIGATLERHSDGPPEQLPDLYYGESRKLSFDEMNGSQLEFHSQKAANINIQSEQDSDPACNTFGTRLKRMLSKNLVTEISEEGYLSRLGAIFQDMANVNSK